jgi:Flp pilus assembly pilin Flp
MEAGMAAYLHNFWQEEDGQDLIEYSLLITFVALACVAFLGIWRPSVTSIWGGANTQLNSAGNSAS